MSVTRVKGEVVPAASSTAAQRPPYQARVLHEHTVHVNEVKNVKSVDEPKAVKQSVETSQPARSHTSGSVPPVLVQITVAAMIGALVIHADSASGILKWFAKVFNDVTRIGS